MRIKQFAILITGPCLVSMVLLTSAQAGTITGSVTLGLPALQGTGNCDPVGCPALFGLGTYQQVYAKSAFPGQLTIDSLSFFDTVVRNGGKPGGGTYTLGFSYTSMAVAALDLQNPAHNMAGVEKVFFSGTLPALTKGTMTFTGTPFFYDPSFGNLLLTMTVNGASDGLPYLFLNEASTTKETSNAYFGSYQGRPISGGNTPGLVSEFGYTAGQGSSVPEPGCWLLVSAGMMGGAGLLIRRRLLLRPAPLKG